MRSPGFLLRLIGATALLGTAVSLLLPAVALIASWPFRPSFIVALLCLLASLSIPEVAVRVHLRFSSGLTPHRKRRFRRRLWALDRSVRSLLYLLDGGHPRDDAD